MANHLTTKLLTLFLACLVLLLIIELIRKEKLTFKYAAGWIVVSVAAIFLTIFDKTFFKVAYFLGFELPSNFIFFTLLTIFVFLTLLMTIFLCQQNYRNDKIAQQIGILEHEIKELKKNTDKEAGGKEKNENK